MNRHLLESLVVAVALVVACCAGPAHAVDEGARLDAWHGVADWVDHVYGTAPTVGGVERRSWAVRVIDSVAERAVRNHWLTREDEECFEVEGFGYVFDRLIREALTPDERQAAEQGRRRVDRFRDDWCDGESRGRTAKAWQNVRARGTANINTVVRESNWIDRFAANHSTCPPGAGGGVCLPSWGRVEPRSLAVAALFGLGSAVVPEFAAACVAQPQACINLALPAPVAP